VSACACDLQGHEFIDVEPTVGYRASQALSLLTANQRAALNDVTTASHGDASDDDDDCDDDGCRVRCCTVRLNVCCDDKDKQVSSMLPCSFHLSCPTDQDVGLSTGVSAHTKLGCRPIGYIKSKKKCSRT